MRRIGMVFSLVVVVLVGLVAPAATPRASAQEATPASEEMMPAGVTFTPVSLALGIDVSDPADLFVARIGLDPGASLPIAESDPSTGMLIVESGTFTVEAEAPVTVTRGAGLNEALMAAEASGDVSTAIETIAAGEVVTLEAGDAAYIPGSINGEIRNDGDDPAVGLAFLLSPPMAMMAEATPAP